MTPPTIVSGPRRLVLNNLLEPVAVPPPTNTGVPALKEGHLRVHSESVPGLYEGITYKASFTQTVTYNDFANNPQAPAPFQSYKEFKVQANEYNISNSAIDSCYPPPGTGVYANTLPHIVFNKAQLPFVFYDPSNPQGTWFALLVFSESELAMSSDDLKTYQQDLGSTPPPPSATLTNDISLSDLIKLGGTSDYWQPIPTSTDTTIVNPIVPVLWISQKLYAGLFQTYEANSCVSNPTASLLADTSRYTYMTSVRNFSTLGLANQDGSGILQCAVSVSARTAPLGITAPTTMYAHLVSLRGIEKMPLSNPDGTKKAALVSLYSWSYTALPANEMSLTTAFQNLSTNLQALRSPEALLSVARNPDPPVDGWVKARLLAGYNLVRQRLDSGETTAALSRGILTPNLTETIDFPPSDFGTDLAIIDESTGIADLTYQLAWQLGRNSAMADRTVSAALSRLRGLAHTKALEQAKINLDPSFLQMTAALANLQAASSTLEQNITNVDANPQFTVQRWPQPMLQESTKQSLSFQTQAVQQEYAEILSVGLPSFANAVTLRPRIATVSNVKPLPPQPVIYNELNSPLSPDWALLLSWIMDRWFLKAIPMIYLIPDPAFVPPESIRTFYVDSSWFKVYVDGAISVAEHYNEGDTLREAMKTSLDKYLSSELPNGFPPQVPSWGFMIRSSIVESFPNLRFSAPRPLLTNGTADPRVEFLRMDVIDQNLLLVLFDRSPGNGQFPSGITFQTPEGQLHSMFGTDAGVVNGSINLAWTRVFANLTDASNATDQQWTSVPADIPVNVTDPTNPYFDLAMSVINAPNFASFSATQMGLASTSATPAMVATQLLAKVPSLQLNDVSLQARAVGATTQSQLTTTRPRPKKSMQGAPKGVRDVLPASEVTSTNLTPPPAPLNPILAALAQTDLFFSADNRFKPVIDALFPPNDDEVGQPPAHNPTPNPTSVPLPQVSTTVYNVRGPFTFGGFSTQFAVVAPYPLSLGFTSNLYVRNLIVNVAQGFNQLSLLQVAFTLGTAANGLLADFPTNTAAATAGPLPSTYAPPRRPDFTGTNIPHVRCTGAGRRWKASTSYTAPVTPATGSPTAGSFIVSLTPNNSQGYWDVGGLKDLSFVLENVLINNAVYDQQVKVFEQYVGAGPPSATSVSPVLVQGFDATKADIVFNP